MPTAYGKELRKLRIDEDETIQQMAEKLNISISYLSSIESGNRKIPNDLTEKIIEKYSLNKERSEILWQAEVESSNEIFFDLSKMSLDQRKLAFVLSRELDDISDEECLKIIGKLKNHE